MNISTSEKEFNISKKFKKHILSMTTEKKLMLLFKAAQEPNALLVDKKTLNFSYTLYLFQLGKILSEAPISEGGLYSYDIISTVLKGLNNPTLGPKSQLPEKK